MLQEAAMFLTNARKYRLGFIVGVAASNFDIELICEYVSNYLKTILKGNQVANSFNQAVL